MNILILGSGGREHAFAWKISKSKLCTKLFIAPGNAGTAECGENIAVSIRNFESVKDAVIKNKIELVIVGPEEPLVNGITDFFHNDDLLKNILILGPAAEGASLEGSKDYAKSFMQRNSIPTAAYMTFKKGESPAAFSFLETMKAPYVLKADGLAAGKGVIISDELTEAKSAVTDILENSKFGSAGEKLVIEEFLPGIELSVFVLTDGSSYIILPEAKDYKRIGNDDKGENTGGMGAVSPVPFADKAFMKKVEERIIVPTMDGLKKENIYYRGFVFIGLMNVDGDPFVIEYNVRMGDPETEVVFPRIDSDVVELLTWAARGELHNASLKINAKTALTVMMVSGGYPGAYVNGKEISVGKDPDGPIIFHAGTISKDGKILTNGGRVLAITSLADSIKEAADLSYAAVDQIKFENNYFRTDIGNDLIN